MPLAADHVFLDALWSMIVFFAFVIWIWMLFVVFGDIFRRHDVSGWGKAAWTLFILVLPFLGVLVYLIAHGSGMAERRARDVEQAQAQFDAHVRKVAGGPAAEISQAKDLLDRGTITQQEFDRLKAAALAGNGGGQPAGDTTAVR